VCPDFKMGNKGSASQLEQVQNRLETRVGKLPVTGRYHRLPKKLEDDYQVAAKVLGSGYNGVVRLATAAGGRQNQKFAIKAFKLSNVAADKKAQLEAEVEIFLAMDHPHITRLFDVYESEDHLHLVMECMEGGELFDRVTELKKFSELDAADATWQMLLALNYIHSHGIVHRDLKLENFLYDVKGSNHLKLIDFGFSKVWDPNVKMRMSCGTLSYVAPEVLSKNYGSQCDLWSLGVIGFILLSGYMPFSGSETVQTKHITEGRYTMKPDRWNKVSKEAIHFTQSLLQVNPEKRLNAQAALDHPWITNRHKRGGASQEVDQPVVDALRQFGQASKFRRCAVQMMAWSLSNEERALVRQHFVSLDQNKQGTITLSELKKVLVEKFHISDEETLQIFKALDSNNNEEIHYSDFLAAMVSTQIVMHDDLLRAAFKKFDTDRSGYITVDNLKQILGETFEGESIEELLSEVDQLKDNRISYAEFVSYLRGEPLEKHAQAATEMIDAQRRLNSSNSMLKAHPLMKLKSDAFKGAAQTSTAVATQSQKCCSIQ